MVVGILSVIGFNVVDTWFIAQLGTDQLAAIGFTFPVVFTLGSLSLGLGAGAASLISRAIGRGDRYQVRCLTTDSLLLTLLLVAILIALGLTTIDPLFRLLGAEERLLPLIRDYMLIWYPGMLFLAVPMVGNNIIRATGDATFPSLVMLIAGVVNAILDPIFIFGMFGMPRLELQGAAIATVIARLITLIAALGVLHLREKLILWGAVPLSRLRENWALLMRITLPAGGAAAVEPAARGVITALIALFGAEAVAGFAVATRIEALLLIPLFALMTGIGPFVGQNWGANRRDRIDQALRIGYRFSLLWGVSIALLLALSGGLLTALFDPNPRVVEVSRLYLLLVPITFVAEGIAMMAGAAWLAIGRSGAALLLTAIRFALLYLPLAYLGAHYFAIPGIFAAAVIANLAVGLIALLWTPKLLRS